MVVVIDGIAGCTRNASSSSSPAYATTLAVLSDVSPRWRSRWGRAWWLGGGGWWLGGGYSWWRTGASATTVDSWAGNGVGGVGSVEVEEDTRVIGTVGTWEGHTTRICTATTSDPELVARDVELCTTCTAGNVESNDFSTEKIITRSDVSWDPEFLLAAVCVESVRPPVVSPDQTVLVDLEPRAAAILGGITNLGEVNNDWTVVVATDSFVAAGPVTWLLVHLNCDSATGWNSTDTRLR